MNVHFKILGWIFAVVGVIGLISVLVTLPMLFELGQAFNDLSGDLNVSGASDSDNFSAEYLTKSIIGRIQSSLWLMPLFWIIAAMASIIDGVGLLARKRWARHLTIVLSIIAMFKVPLGTVFGIYGLWAMNQTRAPLVWDDYAQSD